MYFCEFVILWCEGAVLRIHESSHQSKLMAHHLLLEVALTEGHNRAILHKPRLRFTEQMSCYARKMTCS